MQDDCKRPSVKQGRIQLNSENLFLRGILKGQRIRSKLCLRKKQKKEQENLKKVKL